MKIHSIIIKTSGAVQFVHARFHILCILFMRIAEVIPKWLAKEEEAFAKVALALQQN